MLQQWGFVNTPQKSTNCVRNRIFDAKNGYLEAIFCKVIIFNLWLNENAFSLARSLLLGIHMFSLKFDMSIVEQRYVSGGKFRLFWRLDLHNCRICLEYVVFPETGFLFKRAVADKVKWDDSGKTSKTKIEDRRTQKTKTKTREARNFYTFPWIW